MAEHKVTTKFPGRCRQCNKQIEPNTMVLYDKDKERGQKLRHLTCEDAPPTSGAEGGQGEGKPTDEKSESKPTEQQSEGQDQGQSKGPTRGELFDALVKDAATEVVRTLAPQITEQTQQLIDAARSTKVEIKIGDMPEVKHDLAHKQLPDLIRALTAEVNVWLTGPTGSGKTHAASQAAESLGLRFYALSVGPQTTQSDLFGYRQPNGELVRTIFREAYEHGGVFLCDEVDAGSSDVLVGLNAAISNGSCSFPDGMISKHPRFLLVAAANTWGQGPTAEYIGRSRQDAAFLKRFSRIAWEYDERLETAASGNVEWAKKVQKFRRAAEKRKLRIIITPRDSIMGARLLAAGFTEEQVIDMTILAGVAEDTREALLEATRG